MANLRETLAYGFAQEVSQQRERKIHNFIKKTFKDFWAYNLSDRVLAKFLIIKVYKAHYYMDWEANILNYDQKYEIDLKYKSNLFKKVFCK